MLRPTCDANTKETHGRPRARYLLLVSLILLVVVGFGWFGYWYLYAPGWFANFYTPGWQTALRGHQGGVLCLAFAPDGKTLATGGADGTVRLWDLSTPKERVIIKGHTDNVADVAFSPDSKLLASASSDGSVKLWDAETGRECVALLGNARAKGNGKPPSVLTIAFSPDGRLLASGGSDRAVTLWEVATGKQRAVFQEREVVCSLAITADGKLLACRKEDGIITVRELAGGKELRHFGDWLGKAGELIRLRFLLLGPDGKTLASNGSLKEKEKVKLWNVTTGEERATLKADLWQDWPVYSMAFTPDGKVLVGTTLFGARMVFWDTSSGELLGTIHFPHRALSIAFSPDGKTLASAHEDGTVQLWESEKLIPKK